ncbi:hypothetical protein KK083_21075 [Fulvivirgaceae bacterium PWU4]|uniref:PLOD1-3-like GT domain-containing protein n=1 Tax=Chryseosolibacter histidini TaxID=2782349 RepID=A0AAP2DQC2_9BACT|nr:glycosyltransferase domain-containing protein [Chryseosolibacter histidini]MBT1699403.1 hypothetical protein [Chryseosolibacter histidini]
MRVVTLITNANQKGFKEYLQPSCAYHDLDLTVLKYEDRYTTHRIKDVVLYQYLKDRPQKEIVLFTDAHDTAFLSGEKEIMEKFRSFGTPLVFSAEINCWPFSDLAERYPEPGKHFRYLNSGAFIGEVGYLVDLYETYPTFSPAYDPVYNWSNQYYWHHVYLENQDTIAIDHNCEMFFNTSIPVERIDQIDFRVGDDPRIAALFAEEIVRLNNEIVFSNDRIMSKLTNTWPCHLHLPGPVSKLLMKGEYFASIKAWEH